MGNGVKAFSNAQEDEIYSLSLTYQEDDVVIEDQAGQAGPDFQTPRLSGPGLLAALYMLHDDAQGELLFDLPQHQGQADRPGPLFMDGHPTG